tara:strand:+ start:798 stop:1127 length:330 start_codon:yes stop_codon:yes gene_type:complete
MDLILIPVAPDPEDVKEALAHAKRLSLAGAVKVKFVINRWPNGTRQQAAALEKLEGLPESDILCKVPIASAIQLLRVDDSKTAFKTPPSKINNLARALYRAVKKELELA